MKLINDLITGIRTIKSYAWENHYMSKIKKTRAEQSKNIFGYNFVGMTNYVVFMNVGLVAILAILLPKWYNGEYIDPAHAFSLLALIFFLFYDVTGMVLMCMGTTQQFLVLMTRLADVFCMEEF
jgi:ABC-type multidrug transport system fused ATPase/permease subunit